MTTHKNHETQLPHRALSRAVPAGVGVLVLAGLAAGCSSAASTPTVRGTATSATTPAAATVSTPISGATASGSPSVTVAAQPSATASAQPTVSAGTVLPTDQKVLSPATVPPVDKECSYPITRTSDGNATPLLCQDGRLNVQAWDFYANFANSELLTLGRGATAAQVYQAMCHDYSDLHMTKPETDYTEEIAQAYYGWDVSASSLRLRLVDEGCRNS